MTSKLVVGPIEKGLRQDKEPFFIDNDSFPVMINSYGWRGRVKRKRGTTLLNRLSRFLGTTDGSGNLTVTILPVPIPSGTISITVGTNIFTDPGGASPVILLTTGPGTATLNRSTGVLTILGSNLNTAVIYFPSLPVLGLEDFFPINAGFNQKVGFDTDYAYNISTVAPYPVNDVSFFKNPLLDSINLPGYVRKTTNTAFSWNGQNYQQFWTTNYQGAMWTTNGISVPFSGANVGMQFKHITGIVINSAGPPALATLTIVAHGLVKGDFVFINEVVGNTGINWQTGYVVSNDPQAANSVQVEFPFATLGGAYVSGGIAQYLTNRSDPTKDCIRWYDGDPTNGSTTNPAFTTGNGWVNFMPPLSILPFSIADAPLDTYYLVGARMIWPFKDRLIFLGPIIQSSTSAPFYLQDTVIFSQNGTPYYTASFTNNPNVAVDNPISPTNQYHFILVPTQQTAAPNAYFEDTTGFGGFVSAGVDQPIIDLAPNEDVLLIGFNSLQTRFAYTGNDILPFIFYIVNSELGTSSTFGTITLDKGKLLKGNRGYTLCSQTGAQRFDIEIPDQVFQVNISNNGNERFTAGRDFINEWVYFSYRSVSSDSNVYLYPNQTLFYNYRDSSFAIFNENFTHYGQFNAQTGYTWGTLPYTSWAQWTDPWNFGSINTLQQNLIAGNQQGFVFFRDTQTGEATSLSIQNITIASGVTITSQDHGLNIGDYITISGVQGTIASEVNGKIFAVIGPITATQFNIDLGSATGTYLGRGLIKRMYNPFFQTKQFPTGWELGRKTRIGVQQYLLSTTANGQITLYIFLSTDAVNPYNFGPVLPNLSFNDSLLYSAILYTCPESINLGLTPFNSNLQQLLAIESGILIAPSQQMWHRINTSLIGDTVQLGFTMSDAQMRDPNFNNQFSEIELHAFVLNVSPSQVLA